MMSLKIMLLKKLKHLSGANDLTMNYSSMLLTEVPFAEEIFIDIPLNQNVPPEFVWLMMREHWFW